MACRRSDTIPSRRSSRVAATGVLVSTTERLQLRGVTAGVELVENLRRPRDQFPGPEVHDVQLFFHAEGEIGADCAAGFPPSPRPR
jgi:hypothetical protein